MSLNDHVLVECSQLANNWYQVGTIEQLKKEQIDSRGILKKGAELINRNGDPTGVTKIVSTSSESTNANS